MARSFVAISDLHAHPWAAFATGDGADNSRLQTTVEVLASSLRNANELGIPWVFGGDLVHTAGYALNVVLAELTEVFLGYADVPKIVVWGNHDARGVGGRIILPHTAWAVLERAVPNLTILDPTDVIEAGGLTFSGAGAQPGDLLRLAEESTDVGVYHGTVRGSVGPSGFVFDYGIDPDELQARHRVSVVGDIHHPQFVGGILIPGSPEHHNFGDAGKHGWWVVNLDDEDAQLPSYDFVPSGSPEFLTVETPKEVRADGNYYRVRRVQIGDELPENALAVAPEPTAIASRDVLSGVSAEQAVQAWMGAEAPQGDAEQYRTIGRQLLSEHEPSRLSAAKLTSLTLADFCSYEHAQLPVQAGTWLVTGKGRDYPSNGAGKSSLFEALYWLLFGRTTKGLSGDEVIRWGTKQCEVTGIFRYPSGGYIAARRRRGGSSTLEVTEWADPERPEGAHRWEATSVNEMTEQLTRRLGITPDLYQALGYFSQERLLLFASASDGERKDMLADLIGLSAYQEASSAAASQVTELSRTLLTLKGRVETLAHGLEQERARVTELEQRHSAWEVSLRDALAQAEYNVAEYDRQGPARRALLQEEHGTRLGINLRERVAMCAGELAALVIAIESFAGDGGPSTPEEAERFLEEARTEHAATEAQLAAIRRELLVTIRQRDQYVNDAAEHARLLAEGSCPTCGQFVTAEHRDVCLAPVKAHIVAANQAIERLQEAVQRFQNMTDGYMTQRQEASESLIEARQYAQVCQKQVTATATMAALLQEQEALDQAARDLAERDMTRERDGLQGILTRTTTAVNPHSTHIVAAQQRIATQEVEHGQLLLEQEHATKDSTLYDYWARGFSKRGLQSLLMEEVAVRFNAMRAEIFPALTQGVYDVQFSTLSETKAGEMRERTAFYVYEHGKPVPYEALSGGQRRRVDVGVMLTLILAVSEWMQAPGALGVLILDEVFEFLDAAGAEGLLEALRAVETRIPAIFVVAHNPQLQSMFSQVIRVEQDEQGISHLAEEFGR